MEYKSCPATTFISGLKWGCSFPAHLNSPRKSPADISDDIFDVLLQKKKKNNLSHLIKQVCAHIYCFFLYAKNSFNAFQKQKFMQCFKINQINIVILTGKENGLYTGVDCSVNFLQLSAATLKIIPLYRRDPCMWTPKARLSLIGVEKNVVSSIQ